jgi:hypothetical protein
MPETGSSIINYTGNANLGLGASSTIPVAPDHPDLDAVNQASAQLRLYDHQNNIKLFEQKITDRDTAIKLLAQGKVQAGNILPEDQKYYDAAEAKQTEAYKAIKGMNDKDGITKYLQATNDLNNLVTNTQHRWLEITKLQQEKSSQTLPDKIKAYDDHINTQKAKPIGQLIQPFQQMFSFDMDGMMSAIKGTQALTKGAAGSLPSQQPTDQKTITTTTTPGKPTTVKQVDKLGAPSKTQGSSSPVILTKGQSLVNGIPMGGGGLSMFSQTPERYYDYPTMAKRANDLYLENAGQAENQRQLFDKFHAMPPTAQIDLLRADQKRIAAYSDQRGIEPGADGKYPDEIKFHVMPDGKIILDETIPTFAAKHTLASVEGDYVQKGQSIFNKDIATYLLGKEKADADSLYKRTMGAAAGTKARAYAANMYSQIKKREGDQTADTYQDDVYKRNLTGQSSLIIGAGNGQVSLSNINADNSLPLFTFSDKGKPTLLKPIGSTPIIQKVTNAQGIEVEKIIGYKGGHYEPSYLYNGKAIPLEQMISQYNSFKKTAGSKWSGSFDDYLKEAINTDIYDVRMKGENGSTDKQLSKDVQKAISNPATKKNQSGVFDIEGTEIPVDDQIPEETTTTSSSSSSNQ